MTGAEPYGSTFVAMLLAAAGVATAFLGLILVYVAEAGRGPLTPDHAMAITGAGAALCVLAVVVAP